MNHDTKLIELADTHFEYHDETTFGDYTVKIENDHDPMNPRTDWDHAGTMVVWHNGYNLGDDHNHTDVDSFFHSISGLYEDEHTDYLTDEQLQRCRKVAHEMNIILPLYLYDHSGITMSTGSFSCPWDSGQVGYIYISLETARKNHDWKVITKTRRELIAKYLEGEVEVYDHYLTGSVYGFTITKGEDEEDVDSCWGYFGYHDEDEGYMLSCIKDAIAADIKHTPQQVEMFG